MSVLSTFLGLVRISCQVNKVEEQKINIVDDREEMELAQLEYYMTADDNQGIANLSLYL